MGDADRVRDTEVVSQQIEVVDLSRRWLARRGASVEVEPGLLGLRLPGVFGPRQVWRLPLDAVAVVVTARIDEPDAGGGQAFVEPLTIPYLATATAWAALGSAGVLAAAVWLPGALRRGRRRRPSP